ncbi:MAG: uracil-DNA glycosylase [Prevotellaceae bacterium]|jgi:uracil-DNA glycosylase|nr:uracil-DNA glycosylase [Prevotellaceae bacterium]
MQVKIEPSWQNYLAKEFDKDYFETLVTFVRKEYQTQVIYPPAKWIFRAFDLCPFDRIKVVILGQDPYHGQGQAHGLCFSVQDGVALPPSLQNIYREIADDTGVKPLPSGNLERWACQGVFLLNATLSVRASMAGSHQGQGWERFTDAVIETISRYREHVVFLLWGNYAQQKVRLIDVTRHCVLSAVHPSPLSAHRGFFGCKHFSKANSFLENHGLTPIEWR